MRIANDNNRDWYRNEDRNRYLPTGLPADIGLEDRQKSVLIDLGKQFDELVAKEGLAYQIDEQSLGLDDDILNKLNEAQDGIAELTENILRVAPRTQADWAVQSRVIAYWQGELSF